ncbi:MAG: SCO family protein [Flavobacteriaceae bacterium]|nr:SCO family protein [Flavobacteriaceae bacterium]
MKNYTYVWVSFIILIFGIWSVPKIVAYLSKPDLAVIGKVPDFSFTNQNEKTINNASYKGKVYVVEFFFSTCPSICPIMTGNMVKIQDEFFGHPNFGVASFSINPLYDTPQVLKEYAKANKITNPNWNLLTGDIDAIYNLANKGFSLYVAESAEAEGGFEHSGYFALIDKEGNIRSRYDSFENPIVFYNGLDDKEIIKLKDDIKKLL